MLGTGFCFPDVVFEGVALATRAMGRHISRSLWKIIQESLRQSYYAAGDAYTVVTEVVSEAAASSGQALHDFSNRSLTAPIHTGVQLDGLIVPLLTFVIGNLIKRG